LELIGTGNSLKVGRNLSFYDEVFFSFPSNTNAFFTGNNLLYFWGEYTGNKSQSAYCFDYNTFQITNILPNLGLQIYDLFPLLGENENSLIILANGAIVSYNLNSKEPTGKIYDYASDIALLYGTKGFIVGTDSSSGNISIHSIDFKDFGFGNTIVLPIQVLSQWSFNDDFIFFAQSIGNDESESTITFVQVSCNQGKIMDEISTYYQTDTFDGSFGCLYAIDQILYFCANIMFSAG